MNTNDTFTASNGWKIERFNKGDAEITYPSGFRSGMGLDVMDALREFFQWERDQELERVRYPENPDYVVYPLTGDMNVVWVLNEVTGTSTQISRSSASIPHTISDEVACWYFIKHPTTCGAEAPFMHKKFLYSDLAFQAEFITCDLPAGHDHDHGYVADTWEIHWGQETNK